MIRKMLFAAIIGLACAPSVAATSGVQDAEDGTRALSTRDLDNAVALLTRGIQSDDLSDDMLAVAYHNRGIAHQKQGDTARAILDYTNAMLRGNLPSELRPRALNNRAICFELLGDHEAALRDLNRAIALNGGYADAYVNRASVLRKMTAYTDSVKDYGRASALGYPRPLKIAHGLAQTHEAAGDRAQAIRYYREALAIDPMFRSAHARLGALVSAGPGRVVGVQQQNRQFAQVAQESQAAAPPEDMGQNVLRSAIVDQSGPISGSGFSQESPSREVAVRRTAPIAMPTGRGPKGGPETSELAPVLKPDPVSPVPGQPQAPALHAVQLASYASEALARQAWTGIAGRFATELATRSGRITVGQHPRKGAVYRLNVSGLVSRADADALCAMLKRKGQTCIPVILPPG